MKLTGKNILIISPQPWVHIFVSKHHYATHLAKRGNKVYFLNPPGALEYLEGTDYKDVYSIHYKGFISGLHFLPEFMQRLLLKRVFIRLQQLCNANFDVVWSFDDSVFFDFSALPRDVLTICHIVDLNQNFQFKKAAQTANICFGVNTKIVNKLKKYNSKSYFINHGFRIPKESIAIKIPRYNDGIKAGYSGNLDLRYINWNVIKDVIKRYPSVIFYFAGSFNITNEHVAYLRRQSNVVILGQISAKEIPSFLNQMNLLLLCYQAEQYEDQLSNPHKMMEYLGSGKPIVASFTKEYAHYTPEILMSKKSSEWIDLFQYACENLDKLTTPDLVEKRKSIAFKNNYDIQIKIIENFMGEVLRFK